MKRVHTLFSFSEEHNILMVADVFEAYLLYQQERMCHKQLLDVRFQHALDELTHTTKKQYDSRHGSRKAQPTHKRNKTSRFST
jgi:hypothetical protein